jgi:hypothetical protein
MGGGDSRPRESRSNEYEPREPDDQQGPVSGSTGGEGDTVQTELSGYVREGNPSDEGPVPEFGDGEDPFAELGDADGEDDEDDRGLFIEVGKPDGEDDDEGDNEDDRGPFAELGDADGEEGREADPAERAEQAAERQAEGDAESDGADQGEEGESAAGGESEASQGRVKRMAAMATVWSGAQTGTAAVESGERRAERIAELAARRAEEEATNPDE